jgi:hypothetical protein
MGYSFFILSLLKSKKFNDYNKRDSIIKNTVLTYIILKILVRKNCNIILFIEINCVSKCVQNI